MLYAGIDIGSNAVRLLFANVLEKKGTPVAEKATLVRIPVRLGMDVFTFGRISEQKEEMLIKTMKAFRLLIDVYQPVGYMAVATAAMREASNNQEVLQRVQTESGIEIGLINGIEEANIISNFTRLMLNKEYPMTMYVDVGGGSTEISLYNKSKFLTSNSFKIGTIRLLADKVGEEEWVSMHNWLDQFSEYYGRMNVIGSGGNINKITKLYGDNVTNLITLEQLQSAYKKLNSMSLEDRIDRIGLRPDRADVIVPAAKIFIQLLKWSGLQSVSAPKIGLVDGLVLLQYNRLKMAGLP